MQQKDCPFLLIAHRLFCVDIIGKKRRSSHLSFISSIPTVWTDLMIACTKRTIDIKTDFNILIFGESIQQILQTVGMEDIRKDAELRRFCLYYQRQNNLELSTKKEQSFCCIKCVRLFNHLLVI